jgi:hypothetical protein
MDIVLEDCCECFLFNPLEEVVAMNYAMITKLLDQISNEIETHLKN